MCATIKDLSKHSVVRIVSDASSGWVGIAYGHLITGAKCQKGAETLVGFEALAELLTLENGMFDLIQLDSRLLGDELAQSIGISIDELIREMAADSSMPAIELLRKCKKVQDAVALLMSTESAQPKIGAETIGDSAASDENDDEGWDLGDGDVIESLQRQARRRQDVSEITVPGGLANEAVSEAASAVATSNEENMTVHDLSDEAWNLAGVPANWGETEEAKSDLQKPSLGEKPGYELATSASHNQSQFSPSSYANADHNATANGDMLGTTTRAELHEFIRNKFGGDELIENVDLEGSKTYQASLVLRDLESAIEKSKVDLRASGAFDQLGEAVEIMKQAEAVKPEQTGLRNLSWVKNQTGEHRALTNDPRTQTGEHKTQPDARRPASDRRGLTGEQRALTGEQRALTGEQRALTGEFNRAPAKSLKPEEEQEASRRIFADHVRKSMEVDTRIFLNTTEANTDLETKLRKEKMLRQYLIMGSSICLSVSLLVALAFVMQRQTMLETASQKLDKGDIKSAKTEYEEIIKKDPNNWKAYVGHAMASPDDYQRQIADFNKVLELQPHAASAAVAMANAYFKLRDFQNALKAAERACEVEPRNVAALKIKGAALLKLGDAQKASEALKLAVAQNQKNPSELYYLLASCYHEFKQPDKEIESLVQALKGDPNNTSYLKELGAIYVTQNQLEKAKQTLEKATSVAPADGELHFRLAQIFAREQETDKALTEFSKALDRGYVNTESLGERGKLYYYKHLWGSAKADFEDALDRTPNDKDIRRMLDLSDKAIADAKARVGTRKMPEEVAATAAAEPLPVSELQGDYVGRAYEEMKTGKMAHAIKLLKAAVKVNPNDVRARKYLASSLYAIGDWPEASAQFAYAGAQEQLAPEERFMYGKSLSSAGKQEQAITVLQALVNEQPTYGQARIALIKVFETAGFRDHAREQCQIGIQQARSQAELAEYKALMP